MEKLLYLYKENLRTYEYMYEGLKSIIFKETINGIQYCIDEIFYFPLGNFILRPTDDLNQCKSIQVFNVYTRVGDTELVSSESRSFAYAKGSHIDDISIESKFPKNVLLAYDSDSILRYFEMYIRVLMLYEYANLENVKLK